MAISQHILGIKPTYTGLSINPVIPSDWAGFEARRVFRGVIYKIKVERKKDLGSTRLSADGQLIDGCIIPIPPEGTREVNVLLEFGSR